MTPDLKTEVAAAVAMRWDEFAKRHPKLARVIDQHLLVEQATTHLRLDPDYQRALTNARNGNADIQTIVKLIDKYVSIFLDKLV